jgi:hypothetical protein
MSGAYEHLLDGVAKVFLYVEFKTSRRGRNVVDYSVVLIVEEGGRRETVRLYDGAHGETSCTGIPAMAASKWPRSSIAIHSGPGMRAAIEEVERGYEAMIEAWRK